MQYFEELCAFNYLLDDTPVSLICNYKLPVLCIFRESRSVVFYSEKTLVCLKVSQLSKTRYFCSIMRFFGHLLFKVTIPRWGLLSGSLIFCAQAFVTLTRVSTVHHATSHSQVRVRGTIWTLESKCLLFYMWSFYKGCKYLLLADRQYFRSLQFIVSSFYLFCCTEKHLIIIIITARALELFKYILAILILCKLGSVCQGILQVKSSRTTYTNYWNYSVCWSAVFKIGLTHF